MRGDGTFQCRVILLVWIMVGQGHIVFAVGAGGGSSGIFFFYVAYRFSFPPPSLWGGWMDDLISRPFQ